MSKKRVLFKSYEACKTDQNWKHNETYFITYNVRFIVRTTKNKNEICFPGKI